jgi:YaiO family outer membrane protein
LTDYSNGHGQRRELGFDLTHKIGATTLVLEGAAGQRNFGEERFRGKAATATVAHDWNHLVSTRTVVSLASDSPVFATRSIMQEVSIKPAAGLVVSAGAKHARYFQDVGVNSLSLAAAYHFPRGSVGYRATRYDVDRQGRANGHLVNFRVNDARGSGSTQLWLGSAETLIDSAFELGSNEGRVRSIALRRVQPIAGQFGLSFGIARNWMRSPTGNYQSTRPTIGIVLAH